MFTKVLKSNTLVLSYDLLSAEGKNVKKSQKFDILADDCSAEDIYGIGTTIASILASAVKETRQDLSFIVMEA